MENQLKIFSIKFRLLIVKRNRIFSVFLLAILVGCSSIEVEQAFKGDLRPGKANKVIGEYCQSCHIHKDFDPQLHVSKVRSLYKRPVFRKARECRSCHYIEKDWMHNQHERKTRMPADANRGKYKKFEKQEISRLKKG
ncbi:MAG: hypothetical protein H8E32_17960 [Nitrospinae bacterium]|nr:hypothetical protein [Nitrospinota bacterium]